MEIKIKKIQYKIITMKKITILRIKKIESILKNYNYINKKLRR